MFSVIWPLAFESWICRVFVALFVAISSRVFDREKGEKGARGHPAASEPWFCPVETLLSDRAVSLNDSQHSSRDCNMNGMEAAAKVVLRVPRGKRGCRGWPPIEALRLPK